LINTINNQIFLLN